MMRAPRDTTDTIRRSTLLLFFALSFGLTWGLAVVVLLFVDQIIELFGPLGYTNPLYVLAVWAPSLVAIGLVWRLYGAGGLASFFRRLTIWRMPAWWWAFILVGVPALFYLAAALAGTAGMPFPFTPWYAVLPALALTLAVGPMEEFGWRGFALPVLQRRFAPLAASLVLGVIWGLWHLPAFFVAGTVHSQWAFLPFLGGAVALSIVFTAIFNDSHGSLLVPVVLHFQLNNPIWPPAHGWDTVVFGVAAGLIVVARWRRMTTRGMGATNVLMPETSDARVRRGRSGETSYDGAQRGAP